MREEARPSGGPGLFERMVQSWPSGGGMTANERSPSLRSPYPANLPMQSSVVSGAAMKAPPPDRNQSPAGPTARAAVCGMASEYPPPARCGTLREGFRKSEPFGPVADVSYRHTAPNAAEPAIGNTPRAVISATRDRGRFVAVDVCRSCARGSFAAELGHIGGAAFRALGPGP